MVTGDFTTVEEKFKALYEIQPFAKHIYAMNKLPILANTADESYYRRIHILNFEAHFTDEEKIQFDNIKDNLFTQEALDYLANISLREYLKIIPTRKFANQDESDEIMDRYRNCNSNSVLQYLSSNEVKELFVKDNKVRKIQMYEQYKEWCVRSKHIACGRNNFYKEVLSSRIYIGNLDNRGYDCFFIK